MPGGKYNETQSLCIAANMVFTLYKWSLKKAYVRCKESSNRPLLRRWNALVKTCDYCRLARLV